MKLPQRIFDARQQAHQHAHAVLLCIVRQQLTEDARRDFFPLRPLVPLCRRQDRSLAGLRRDALREPALQRGGRTQDVDGPRSERVDDRTQRLQLAPAVLARGEVGFEGQHLGGMA